MDLQIYIQLSGPKYRNANTNPTPFLLCALNRSFSYCGKTVLNVNIHI
jgi:hypothetical protein